MRSPAGKQRGARPYRGHSAGGSTGLLAQGGGARRQVLGKGVPWPRGAPSAVKGGTAADRRCVPGAWGAAEMGGLCPWCGERAAWQKRASRGSRWGSSRLLAPASQRRAGVGGGGHGALVGPGRQCELGLPAGSWGWEQWEGVQAGAPRARSTLRMVSGMQAPPVRGVGAPTPMVHVLCQTGHPIPMGLSLAVPGQCPFSCPVAPALAPLARSFGLSFQPLGPGQPRGDVLRLQGAPDGYDLTLACSVHKPTALV